MPDKKEALEVVAATVEGEDQNTNHHGGEPIMCQPISPISTLSLGICPRCEGPIEVVDGDQNVAISRASNPREIEICPPCGSDEALRVLEEGNVVPISDWPLHDPHRYHQPLQDAVNAHLIEKGMDL